MPKPVNNSSPDPHALFLNCGITVFWCCVVARRRFIYCISGVGMSSPSATIVCHLMLLLVLVVAGAVVAGTTVAAVLLLLLCCRGDEPLIALPNKQYELGEFMNEN